MQIVADGERDYVARYRLDGHDKYSDQSMGWSGHNET